MDDFKELRLKNKMTQQEVSDKSGISLRQLVRIEKGECLPNLETKILLFKALNMDEEKIIEYVVENYIKN